MISRTLDREQLLELARLNGIELTPEQVERTLAFLTSDELSDADLEAVSSGKLGGPLGWGYGPAWGGYGPAWGGYGWGGGGLFAGGPWRGMGIFW